MDKRIGDRRGHPRFEIVGTLTGSLEIWQRFRLRNLAPGGALVESAVPFQVGSRIEGRVTIFGQVRDVRSEVRRVSASRDRLDAPYLVALEWGKPLNEEDPLLTADVERERRVSRRAVERRRGTRVALPSHAEVCWSNWLTVELMDISRSGVLFSSPAPLPIGDRGQLLLRLGERGVAADVQIQRGDNRSTPERTFRLGAVFTSMDEASELTLDAFIGHPGR